MLTKVRNIFSDKPLLSLLLLAFIIRFILAFFFYTVWYADQTYQTLEQAHRLVFGSGFIPIEWTIGIRSWVFPGFLAGIMKVSSYISSSPKFYMAVIDSVMIAFSLLPIYVTFRLTQKNYAKWIAVAAAGLPVCSWILIKFSYLTFSGMLPAYLFALNIYLIICYMGDKEHIKNKSLFLVYIGAIFGLISTIRFHLLPEVAFAMLYCCKNDFKFSFKWIVLGFALIFLPLCGVLDWLTLGYPFQSIIKNIYLNIFQGYANHFGVTPFWFYIFGIWSDWGLAFIPACALAYLGFRKYPLIMWIGLINLITFSLIGHKEPRFIFLFYVCFTMSAGIGIAVFFDKFGKQKFMCLSFYGLFLICSIVQAYKYTYIIQRKQSIAFSMKLHDLVLNKLNSNVDRIFQFNTYKNINGQMVADAWCGGGYTFLNLNIPYDYQGCWGINNHKFLENNNVKSSPALISKIKVVVAPKDRLVLGASRIYCDNNFCAYAYPQKITFMQYSLWKILPFSV